MDRKPIQPSHDRQIWIFFVALISIAVHLGYLWYNIQRPYWEATLEWQAIEADYPIVYHVLSKREGKIRVLGKTRTTEFEIRTRKHPTYLGVMACTENDLCSEIGWINVELPERTRLISR